jgi:probable phosphoglycerate mutase
MDDALLLEEAALRPTLAAELEGEPMGLIQFHPEKEAGAGRGWISLYCICRGFRTKGYGIQLLGQAVQYYRAMGRHEVCLALTRDNAAARRFFTEYGFRPAGEKTADGREVWTKEIGFRESWLEEGLPKL